MSRKLRLFVGLLALAMIAVTVPTIVKAQYMAPCNTYFTPPNMCSTPNVLILEAKLDRTPCDSGSVYGVLYAKCVPQGGGPECWAAVGNCRCN